MSIKGINPIITSTLIILFGITAISLILNIARSSLDKSKDSAIINEGLINLELIDDTIREVASENEGSKRTLSLKVTEGTYEVDSAINYVNFTYELKSDLILSGQRSGVSIKHNGNVIELFINYTSIDIQGTGHFPKGDNLISILHNGTNSSTNYPIIYVTKS